MKFVLYGSFFLALFLVACQSAPPAAAVTEPKKVATAEEPAVAPVVTPDPSSIRSDRDGFSPQAQKPANTLHFVLHGGLPATIDHWALRIVDASGKVQKTTGGDGTLPPAWDWDGTKDDGTMADQGLHHAELTVVHQGSADPEKVWSSSFTVDVTPAQASIETLPLGDGYRIRLTLVAGGASVATWRLGVVHPNGARFIDFINQNHPEAVIDWNGRAENNAALEPGTTYQLDLQILDVYGRETRVTGSLAVPARQSTPVAIQLNGRVIGQTAFYFPPFSADWTAVGPDLKEQNEKALEAFLSAMPTGAQGRVRVVGHANALLWRDPAAADREQRETLVPLSRARAQAIVQALVTRGQESTRFSAEGVGSAGALVPFDRSADVWQNRRVEFLVEDPQS